jgi:hypothetical protein
MNIVFFHIPRTAGSSVWHSLVESFYEIENLGIGDTYFESFKKYGCVNHEVEILEEFLNSDFHGNRLIHVHSKIQFCDLNNIDLVVFGKRSLFTWRTSLISYFYLKHAHNWKIEAPKRQIFCTHPQPCTKKNRVYLYFLAMFSTTTNSIFDWYQCASPKGKSPKYEILTYDLDIASQIKLGNRIKEIVCDKDTRDFTLKRYGSASNNLKTRGFHDSIGLQRFLANLINILTLLPFLTHGVMRGLKKCFKTS